MFNAGSDDYGLTVDDGFEDAKVLLSASAHRALARAMLSTWDYFLLGILLSVAS
jgi:hypothetical protein